MFDWFKKRADKIPPEQTEAYKHGQRAAQDMAADLDAFMETRFSPAFKGYLKVLQDRFNTTFDRPEAPPIVLARIEFDSFLENVDELKVKMTPEMHAAMKEWGDLWNDDDMRNDIQRFVEHRVEKFMSDLTEAGLQLFLGMADRLKEADKHWRVANPQKAAQFPIDKT